MNKSTPVDRLRWGGKGNGQPTDPLPSANDGAWTAFSDAPGPDAQFAAGPFSPFGVDAGLPFVAASPALPSWSADIGAIPGGPVLNSSPPSGFGNADTAVHGPQARSTYAVTGSGISIGIISDGFNAIPGDLSTAVADGTIGSYSIVKDDPQASTDEGLAMAEIVHSIAPGAQVFFYSGDFGPSSYAQGITTLAQDGCQIICDDEYYYTEPFYQQGAPISAAIDNAVQQYGVTYFTAAGNSGPQSFYEGHFNSTTSFATTLPIGTKGAQQSVTAFNFGTGSSKTAYEQINVPNGLAGNDASIDLQWDQPFQSISGTGSAYSLQFYLFDGSHHLVVNPGSGSAQVGVGPVKGYGVSGMGTGNDVGQDPVQWNVFPDPNGSGTYTTYYLAVTLNGGAIPAGQDQFKVILSNDAFTPITLADPNAGVGSGTVFGHAADPNAITVGAVDYQNTPALGVSPPQIEPFSSSGPGQTLINASGQQLASPQSDGKVTLAAPDGSSTDLPPSEGLNPFYGTSAATPAAAAIAALMLQENPALTPAQINSMLAQSAIAMGNSNVSGAGLVQADAAVALAQGAKAPTVTAIAESPSTGDLGIGKSATLTLTMSAPVTVAGGTPTLSLNDNATANYDPGKSTSTSLVFDYTVAGTDASVAALAATSVNLPSGVTIKSSAGTNANLSLAGVAQAGPQIDTTLPTVVVGINSPDVNLANSKATVTFTFSDAPTAFALGDASATGGTLGNLTGSGTSYTAIFTAAANTDIGNATVAVTPGSWQKANGNPGKGGSTNPFTVDTVTPTVAVSIDKTDVNLANPTGKVTFTFSEAPTNFSLADVSATGGTLSGFAGSGTSYTATFTGAANTDISNATVAVTAGSWQEGNGNPGAGGSTAPFTVDQVTPTVAVGINNSDVNLADQSGTVTFTFSEAPTSFSLADTSATGGTLTNLTGSGTSYTATFTAAANTDIANASVAVTAGSWQEQNGNAGAGGSSAPFTVDSMTPTVAVSIDNTNINTGSTSGKVTFTFSEAPTGFSLDDTVATGGFLSNLSGSGTSYTATFNGAPNTNINNASVAVTAGSWQEANGNSGAGGSTAPFTVNTVTPTVAVSINNTSLDIANPSGTVTFTFTSAPTSFTLGDTSATGGTLGNLTGSGTSYTATFTAAPNTDTGNASVAVTAGKWQDGSANQGAGGSTAPFTIDTVTPTVSAIAASPNSGDENTGNVITLTVTMSESVTVTGTPALLLNDGGTATYQSGSGSNMLVFAATVANAQNVPTLAVTGNNLNGSSIAVSDAAGNPADLSGANVGFPGLAIGATVQSVASSPSSGDLGAGKPVTISVTMSEPVTVTGGTPTLSLNDGGTATYKSGSGTNVLNFSYTVGAVGSGQNTPALAVTQFNTKTAKVYDSGLPADTADLSGATALTNGPKIDTTAPTVLSVAANPANGDLDAGKSVTLTVTFSEAVTVNSSAGSPTLNLNDGGKATYGGGSGTNSLTFTYVVAGGQNTADLAVTALAPNGATIKDLAGNTAVLTGAATNPLGILKIDTLAPKITSISANPANADLGAGKSVTLTVKFSEAVTVGGVTPATTPFLTLNDLGTATYTGGSGTTTLTFVYTIAAGQNTPDLTVTGLNLNGATIQDGAGNDAVLSGAVANPSGTLKIDTTPPTVTSVVSSPATGEVTSGQLVTISFGMSEAVTVTGTPVLLLNDGATASYDKAKSNATTAVFDYKVASSQVTTDLVISGIKLASTSAIKDLAGNAANLAGAAATANLGLQVNTAAAGAAGPSGGNVSITGATALDLFGPATGSVTFATGSTGTLELVDSQDFAGTVAGLAAGNHLDLADIAFGAGTKLGYTPNGGNTGGTLSITDGTHTANLALLGSYVAANFAMSSDGNGGTVVVDPPAGSSTNPQGLASAHQ